METSPFNIVFPPAYRLVFNETSPPTNTRLFMETSPFNIVFAPANILAFMETSPFTNIRLFKEASLLKIKATPLGTDVVAPPVNACKYGVTV